MSSRPLYSKPKLLESFLVSIRVSLDASLFEFHEKFLD
jgi:hypothetical protein